MKFSLFNFVFISFIAMSFYCCSGSQERKMISIGISYQNLQNEFIINIQDAARKKATALGVELLEADGQGKAENQISQIENFISLGVDAIILSPFDKEGCAPAVEKANQAGIPIVVMNSVVSNLDKANAYVGSDDIEAGRIEAEKMSEALHGKGNLVVLHGAFGHSAELGRSEGIEQALKKYPGIKITYKQTANWDRAQALSVMENILSTRQEINGVIAQNDEMALGAYKAIEAAGKQKEILVIGVDAIPDALRSVKDGQMIATVFQDAIGQGSMAVELARDLAEKKKVIKTNHIPFQLVTKENVIDFSTAP